MSHEPECPKPECTEECPGYDQCFYDCICDHLKTAYKRGRDDALPAIVAALNGKYPNLGGIALTTAEVDAARGGEQVETNFLENSDELLRTHVAGKCAGEYCTIHNRSDHSMRSFPQHWRGDRGIMERICPHGIGHPDPDEVYMYGKWDSHACDGCCQDLSKP